MKDFSDYFEIIKFATPETNVRLKSGSNLPKSSDIIIKKCMNWEDVMHLGSAEKILQRAEINCQWYIPYKPFARQDRVTDLCHGNETNLLATVLNSFTNFSANLKKFIFLDVHSKNSELGCCNIPQPFLLEYFTDKIKYVLNPSIFEDSLNPDYDLDTHDYALILPDAGASTKYSSHKKHKFVCSKKRDSGTGKLSGFEIPWIATQDPKTKQELPGHLILIDDICDGGGTFIGIGELLQNHRTEKRKLILMVTHGIFSKGFDELLKYYDAIITTNSVYESQISNDRIIVLDVLNKNFINRALKHMWC